MKKRWLTILLLCCMALTLLSTASYAENDEPGGISMEAAAPESGSENPKESGDTTEENPPETEYEAVLVLGEAVTQYETVTAAAAAAQEDGNSGCTVKLLKNITLSAPLWANKGTFTLDLAGFCLTGNFGRDRATLRLGKDSAADLTVTDSSETGTGCIENTTRSGDSSAVLAGGGKLTVNGGRFRNGLQADDNAQVRINGGTFVRTRWYNFEWGSTAGGFTLKVTDGRQVHDLLREGYELYYAGENRFVNCRSGKQYYEEELTLLPHPTHNNNKGNGECDCGYVCTHEEFQDGVCTVCGSAAFVKLTDSAGTETKYFTTLTNAFNAVPDKSDTDTVYTVTVLGSRELSGWQTVWNKRLTLDLGGQTLSGCMIAVKGGTELTVAGNGTMNEWSKIDVSGECRLYVRGGTIESVSVASSTQGENGTVYLQGGTIGLSLYKSGDAVLTGGTLTSLSQADSTAMGMAPSVPLSGIIPVGYALEYADGYRGKLPRDTGIKNNDALRRTTLRVVSCDHDGSHPKENDPCVYCGAENPIYYDLQGGSMDVPNPSCCAGEDITLRSPTRNGYRFVGWSGTGLDGVTPDVTIPKGSTGERYYTAHWEEKSGYSVRFDTGGGTAVGDRTDLKWSEPVLSGISQPKKAGYVFLGWKCNNKSVEEYTTYAELAADDAVMTVTLTAEWRQTEPPVLHGLTADADYCESAAFTVSGEKRIAEVKAGDTVLTADSGGLYTLRGALGKVTVTATDEDGQTASVTVTIHGGHSFGAWSANGDGTHTRTCSRDAKHAETAGCTGGTATCKEKAVCAVCGEGYGKPGEHRFTAEVTEGEHLASAATCTEAAVYHKSCAYCGENGTESFTFGAPLGHTFGGWVTEKAPTRTEKGEKARVCSVCGRRETQEIPALGGSTGGGQTGGNGQTTGGQTTGGNTGGKTTPDNGKHSDTSGGKADATAAPTAVPKPTETEATKTAAAEETNTATQPEKTAAGDTNTAAQPENTGSSGRLWIVLVLSLLLAAAALYIVYRRRAAARSKH